MAASATQAALNAEIAARKAADTTEASTRAEAVTQINRRLMQLESSTAALLGQWTELTARVAALEAWVASHAVPVPAPILHGTAGDAKVTLTW